MITVGVQRPTTGHVVFETAETVVYGVWCTYLYGRQRNGWQPGEVSVVTTIVVYHVRPCYLAEDMEYRTHTCTGN